MTRVVLLLNNPFVSDSRSWKLATSLTAAGCDVTVVGRARDGLADREDRDGYRVVRVAQPRPLAWLPAPPLPRAATGSDTEAVRAAEAARSRGFRARVRDTVGRGAQAGRYVLLTRAWSAAISAALEPVVPLDSVDIWQSEGMITLPVALRLRGRHGGRVVYDSRDIHLQSARFALLPGPWRRLLARRERAWAQAADAVVTVNNPYARYLERTLGRSMTLVFNGPLAYEPPDPPERRFHEQLGLPAHSKVALMLGAVMPHRGTEQAAVAIGSVPDVHLVVIGEGIAKPAIMAEAAALPQADRIHFLPESPPDQIPAWTASADVSLIPIQASTLNHRLNTPTRIFDAMGAGVPVVAADLPGLAEIVRETGIGVLVDATSTEAIAAGIREIVDAPPERKAAWREACLAAARGPYAWERGVERLLALYGQLTGGSRSR
jgi:glycosyltransferase involved in cell wall biosynthesis